MSKRSKFEKQVDALTEEIIANIRDADQPKKAIETAIKVIGVVAQVVKDLHDIGEFARSQKGR